MRHTPAAGERGAVRGYRWQYDHIATRVYDSMLDGDFVSLRLTDPEAGRVDDLVLVRRGRVDAYQFKSVEFDSYVTFGQLTRQQRTRSGKTAPSLIHQLAQGWRGLRSRHNNLRVHLVTQQLASVNDHLGETASPDRPSPDHFSAFLAQVLRPLHSRVIGLDDVESGWQPALTTLRQASGVELEEFEAFLQSLCLDVAAGPTLPASPSTRQADIIALSDALFRRVSNSSGVVELDLQGVLQLMGWVDRPRLHSRHEFPVDLDTYAPLQQAIEELIESIDRHNSGYVAVIGSPGTGKSTLLSQALTGNPDRVIRYYAYVPGSAPARTRLTARGFLHDVVLMLDESGVGSRERQLPSDDIVGLRQQLVDQLDAASVEFIRTGRRTIVVVDGLDHVDRDHPGTDGLLAELPHPTELPEGVIFVVGSRTLGPLHPYARHEIDERQSLVDLQHHRLPPAAILEVCRRAAVTTDLPTDVHRRIAELSDGHPLALSYLINRLRDAAPDEAGDVLAAAPAYAGDIAAEYLAMWDAVDDDDVIAILAVCSRLRIGFSTEWLTTWAPSSAVSSFRRKFLYLFRHHHDGWRFFHDSFRQFAADRTAQGDDQRPDPAIGAAAHRRVAELCANTNDPLIVAEELYHRYCSGEHDKVLALAQQTAFRDQYLQLRSPELIRNDITVALVVAADRGDALVLLRLLFSLSETTQRTQSLEDLDMPGLLYDVGLVDEAIAYCGAEARRVPLAHAYGLAARLGRADDPAGRRIFDLIEHDGLDDPDRVRVSGQEDDAALAWVRAAAMFRPLSTVLSGIRNVLEKRSERDRDDRYARGEAWRRYERMMEALIDALGVDETALTATEGTLGDHTAELIEARSRSGQGSEEAEVADGNIATLVDLRVRTYTALLESATDGDVAQAHLDRLLPLIRGVPMFYSTMLDAAELLMRYEMVEPAMALLKGSPYARAVTVHELGSTGDPHAVDRHFRYWRLRYLLAPSDEDVPESIKPSEQTPAGDEIAPDAPVQTDVDAIELAARMDSAIRTLARLDAATASGEVMLSTDVWSSILPLLGVFRPSSKRSSASLGGIGQKKSDLMQLVVRVAMNYGGALPQRLADLLNNRFTDQPDQWSTSLRLELADSLRSGGVNVPWYADTLASMEASVTAQDVYSRLEDTAELSRRHVRDGEVMTARDLARRLVPMAFGVGYRKDYQFDSWVAWLGRALAGPGGGDLVEDAAWLARVLVAADPMTEGAPGSAAADLAALVVPVAPVSAVRIFEYLVRHETVDHLDALAELVRTIVEAADDKESVELAADITAHLIAPASTHAYPKLAEALVTTATRVVGIPEANRLATSIADRTDIYALPTTRRSWREGLGLPTSADERRDDDSSAGDDYGALVLTDGRRIGRNEVAAQIRNVADIVALRRSEAKESSFSWERVIDGRTLTSDEIQTLAELFGDPTASGGEVLAVLAESAERAGEQDMAMRLAVAALQHASPDSWSRQYGGARRKAAATAVRIGGQESRVMACRDLVQRVMANRWLAGMLLSELADLVEALDPHLGAQETWTEVRAYIEGIASTLDLPDADVIADHGCRWWLLSRTEDRRARGDDASLPAALAELAVGHLSHPTWLVRDATTIVVVRALARGNDAVAAALNRFAQPNASDDILERAGRCLSAARSCCGYETPPCLQQLEETLADHPSQILRDLAAERSPRAYRPLSPVYDLALPAPTPSPIGAEPVFLAPHEEQYEMVAQGLGLDLDTLLAVAGRYASDALAVLPDPKLVRRALAATKVQHTYPTEKIAASRAAFGRVLADLRDAGLLDGVPPHVAFRLRTVDVELLVHAPQARPTLIPPPPSAGHDQTTGRWRAEIEDRLEEYVAHATEEGRMLIGARNYLTVLNWGHLEEELSCGVIVGKEVPEGRVLLRRRSMTLSDLVETSVTRRPTEGEPLVLENEGHQFHQIHADWLAFRPDVAAILGWSPDRSEPGCWYTEAGDRAVHNVWWVDGWWGRAGPAFDDTEAVGYAVILTSAGIADVVEAFGAMTQHIRLIRRGWEDGVEVESISAARSMPLTV